MITRRKFLQRSSLLATTLAAGRSGPLNALAQAHAADLGGFVLKELVARTSMTEGVFADMMKKPANGFDYFDPANVAPLVVWLGSEQSHDVTGQVFEAAGGMIAVAEGWRTGPRIDHGARWNVAGIGGAVAALVAQREPAQRVYGG